MLNFSKSVLIRKQTNLYLWLPENETTFSKFCGWTIPLKWIWWFLEWRTLYRLTVFRVCSWAPLLLTWLNVHFKCNKVFSLVYVYVWNLQPSRSVWVLCLPHYAPWRPIMPAFAARSATFLTSMEQLSKKPRNRYCKLHKLVLNVELLRSKSW